LETQKDLDPVALSWRIKERPGATVVEFHGEIDENADFTELKRRLRGPLIFHLGEVRRINSCGVREWVNFIRDLNADSELTFVACSPAIVTQLNMIYNFRGHAKVRSFLAPYVCLECEREEEKLLDVATHFSGRARVPPEFSCEKCSGTMEFDDLPERYLSFLSDS
jgi:anti-anti-sigma regulatory factor